MSATPFCNELFVSAASIWEIAIKARLGRLSVPQDLIEEYRQLPAR